MYIAQAFNVLHDWWRYLIGIVVAIIGVFIFSIPHFAAVFVKRMEAEVDLTRLDDMNYLLSLFDSNTNLIFILLPFAGGLIFLLFIVKLLHKQSITSLTTVRPKTDWKRIWFAFFFWGIISSGMVLLDYYLSPENYLDNFELNRFLLLAVIAIVLIPFQTSFEEYLFRGYLMQGIGVIAKNKWVPLVITSVIFGLLHIANPEVEKLGYVIMVYYIGTGLFLGIITLMDDGLELALGFHAANNLFTALLVTANWTAFQTHSVFKDIAEPDVGFIDLTLPVFIIFPILLFIFSRVYKWTNWKEKLFGKVTQPPKENYKILE
ncbi:CPBP family intramembrane glutamic endopeptidase [Lacinutrix chionoecetis]